MFKEHIVLLHTNEAKTLKIDHPTGWRAILQAVKGSKDLLMTVEF